MKDSAPIYRMSDIRGCCSTVADPTLSKWIDRGLVPHKRVKRGIRSNIRYSALNIVQIVLLAQFSTWGVLTGIEDTKVFAGYMPQADFILLRDETELIGRKWPHFDEGSQSYETYSLTDPDKIVGYYRKKGPDLNIIVQSQQVPVEQDDRRMRRTKTEFQIRILTESETLAWEADQDGPDETIQLLTIAKIDRSKLPNEFVDIYEKFGFLKLRLGHIIRHVYRTLGIPELLDNF